MKTNFKKQALSLVLSLSMVVGLGVTTFASGPKGPIVQPAVAKAKELKIKKVLNLPTSGVKTPTETFTFNFTAQSFNGKDTEKNTCPAITSQTVTYAESDKDDQDTATTGKQVIKLTPDALKNVTFPKVGQYVYTVKETKGNTEDMTYSGAEYTVSIFTQTKGSKIVVSDIQIKQDKKDDGTAVQDPKKNEYTPGTDEDHGKGNGLVFNNNYDKKGGNKNPKQQENPEDTDKKGFTLKKLVDGKNVNSDEKFGFTLKVTKPEGTHADNNAKFSYKIVSKDSVGEAVQTEYGKDFKVELKHGERIVFADVLLGSKVKVTESDAKGYLPSLEADSKLNGQVITLDATPADANGKIIFTDTVIGEDGDNFVTVKNSQQTAVGFILNNLPFIVLVAFAGFGILFFVKNKKDKDEEEQRA